VRRANPDFSCHLVPADRNSLGGSHCRRPWYAANRILDGGGEGEWTLRRNRQAFDEIELLPRILHDVSHLDTATTVLGSRIPLPIVLSPVGAPGMFPHEGELAVARAAGHAGLPYGVSTLATQSLEIVAATAGGPLWFQGRILVRGVLWPCDARRAVDEGVDGVVVSNHGGRERWTTFRPASTRSTASQARIASRLSLLRL
jgi:isopentenyl diphosphate isomerase/L-lactate dehydrogenase-like FMN-dependent dehydrogenase